MDKEEHNLRYRGQKNTTGNGEGDLPMGLDNYLKPENKAISDDQVKQVTDSLVIRAAQ